MGMHVDDAGREHEAVGVHRLPRAFRHVADLGDVLPFDGNIGADQRISHTVGDHGAANHEIMHSPIRSLSS